MPVIHTIKEFKMINLAEVSDAELVCEIYRRLKGESEMHYYRNYLFRRALRPIYTLSAINSS